MCGVCSLSASVSKAFVAFPFRLVVVTGAPTKSVDDVAVSYVISRLRWRFSRSHEFDKQIFFSDF